MGNFKFDVIPSGEPPADKTIYESDVIDFSFSRTPIEDVYTKVILKYKWDYGREDFGKTYSQKDDGSLLYYGLDDDHSKSTLTVDDNRGKYIRDNATAQLERDRMGEIESQMGPPDPQKLAVRNAYNFDPANPDSVKTYQQQLNDQGYTDSDGQPLTVDGIFSSKTAGA